MGILGTPDYSRAAADATFTPRAATALTCAAFIAYGHSHVAGNGEPTTAKRRVNQSAALSGTALTNRGTGGYCMAQTMHKISGGGVQREPNTKALVALQSVLNDVLHTTDADFPNDVLGFTAALRTALRILRSSAYIYPTDASITYGGTWGSSALTGSRGGFAKQTSVVGATVTIPNPGTGEVVTSPTPATPPPRPEPST
ncbi:hypothetical protein AB4089_02175 [Arthrobacter sp. 2MCAF15]|uniref:hypothetical protein n=1 Tax=Arthrobacter sp. 2MCAF15 TaxID=3232984 RepID=UPI003F8FB0AE